VESEIQLFMLKTQKIREKAAKQLQSWIAKAERAAEQAQDEQVQREWIKLAGFLHQILNGLLKSYDTVRLDEGIQTLERLFEKFKEKQAQLEMRERELAIKEEEVNRKLAALAKAQQTSQNLEGEGDKSGPSS